MPKQNIPEREPIGDTFRGVISLISDQHILSTEKLPSARLITNGDFVIRYGIVYLGKPMYSIVPDLVVMDYGDMLVGEDAWKFLIEQSNLYPRSDVFGCRNDGRDEMLFVKELDFAFPIEVLAFANESDRKPIATLSALIASKSDTYPEKTTKIPPPFRHNSRMASVT